jgi:ribose 5-phosphate isomerase B
MAPMNSTIYLASDHAGFDFKKMILERFPEMKIVDLGPKDSQSTDYPDWADQVASKVANENAMGILVCGSGIGMCIRANRHKGVRAAMAWDIISARLSREHNDANVLCLGARLIPNGLAFEIIEEFFKTKFAGGRHQNRVDKIDGPVK